MSCIIIERTRAPLWPTCARYCDERDRKSDREEERKRRRETHREKFMRGRNEQPNRTKWTYLASPRINKQQQMTAYVRPFLRHRFHRSGSRSVKDPLLSVFTLSLSLSLSVPCLCFSFISYEAVFTTTSTASGVPPFPSS
mgnify:CR=1 FL=1